MVERKEEPIWVKALVIVLMAIVLWFVKEAFDRMDAADEPSPPPGIEWKIVDPAR